MEVISASQEPVEPVDLILDSSDLKDSSDCELDSDPPVFVSSVAMSLQDDRSYKRFNRLDFIIQH